MFKHLGGFSDGGGGGGAAGGVVTAREARH
jgi:hypothetical protein